MTKPHGRRCHKKTAAIIETGITMEKSKANTTAVGCPISFMVPGMVPDMRKGVIMFNSTINSIAEIKSK